MEEIGSHWTDSREMVFFSRICRTNSNFAKIEVNVTDMKTYMHVYKYKEYGRDRKAEETVDDVKRNVAPKCYVTRTSRTRYLTSTNQNRYRWANLLGVMKRPSVAAELQHYLDSRANYLHKHIWACLCRKMCRVAACCCPALRICWRFVTVYDCSFPSKNVIQELRRVTMTVSVTRWLRCLNMLQYLDVSRRWTMEDNLYWYSKNQTVIWDTLRFCFHLHTFKTILLMQMISLKLIYDTNDNSHITARNTAWTAVAQTNDVSSGQHVHGIAAESDRWYRLEKVMIL